MSGTTSWAGPARDKQRECQRPSLCLYCGCSRLKLLLDALWPVALNSCWMQGGQLPHAPAGCSVHLTLLTNHVTSHLMLQLPCFPRDIMDHSLKPQPRRNLLSLQLLFVQYLFCHNENSTNPQVPCPGSRTQTGAPRKANGSPFITTQWWLVQPSVLPPLLLGCAPHRQIPQPHQPTPKTSSYWRNRSQVQV